MRNWRRTSGIGFGEPSFAREQREPLRLNPTQKHLATSRTASGFRRIRGPAGSGKSLVLASRAADLLSRGKDVLVVTFNITLIHYLQDLCVRRSPHGSNHTRAGITWLNFHAWCKRTMWEAGRGEEYHQLWRSNDGDVFTDEILNVKLATLVRETIQGDTDAAIPRYDAVLVVD